MIEYKYFNANPKGNDTNDCVIRAIATWNYYCGKPKIHYSINVGEEYDMTYKLLFQHGIRNSLMINDEKNYMMYLKDVLRLSEKVFEKNSIKVRDLENVSYKRNMIVNLNGHLTVIICNTLLDTFDCRDEYVESIFFDKWGD